MDILAKHQRLLGALILLVLIPVPVWLWVVRDYLLAQRWLKQARRTQGKIVHWQPVYFRTGKEARIPIIEFIAHDGGTYTTKGQIIGLTRLAPPDAPETLQPVLYNPGNPADAIFEDPHSKLMKLGFIIPILTTAVCVCLWAIFDSIWWR